jgi:hypothetical protein
MVSVCHLPLLSERHRRVSWIARRFLARRASRTGGEIDIEDLASAEISAYLLEVTPRLVSSQPSGRRLTCGRCCDFCLDGILESDLDGAMPPVATWRGTRLPRP